MDSLRIIPQLFFDLIARVIPGAVALFVVHLAFPGAFWRPLLEGLAVGRLSPDNVAAFTFLTLPALAYTAGQLLAPIGGLLDHAGTRHRSLEHLFQEPAKTDLFRRRLRADLGDPPAYTPELEDAVWRWYDWLRVHSADAGALTAKIRAEYIMYNSLAAAFALGGLLQLARWPERGPGLSLLLLGLLWGLAGLMAWRGYGTQRIFRLSVQNLYLAARYEGLSSRPSESSLPAPKSAR